MRRKNGMTLIGLTIVVAGLVGCEDSPMAPAAFDPGPPALALVELVVQNATGTGVVFFVEYGQGVTESGSGAAGEVVSLGAVGAFEESRFALKPSAGEAVPARFFAVFDTGDEIESDWMWLEAAREVELLITPLGVLRTDAPGLDIDDDCPIKCL